MRQITRLTWSPDHSVSSNNSFESQHIFNTVEVMRSTEIFPQCPLQGWCKLISVMWIQLQEKTEKNPHHQQYQQKYHLMVTETFNVNKICSSLSRNLLNVKHRASWKLMYSKYQIKTYWKIVLKIWTVFLGSS